MQMMLKHTDSSFVPPVPEPTCQRFTLAEIQLATLNFNEAFVIGHGGFGKVYKCRIVDRDVAVKRLKSMSNQGAREFWAEVEMLSSLRHCNLVSLIGYCNDEPEMILVYEFMPHGTLEDHLLNKVGDSLTWLERLKICIGAARGLDYLHTGTGTQHGVIHRDVKGSNILLDANFAAKISDFGLAKTGPTNQRRTHVSTGVKGTFGYMDPCYFYSGKLTRKSDVYAFGVVLFQVLCGRPAVDETLDEEQCGLTTWAQDQIKKGKLSQIIDTRLRGQISKNCLKDFVSIAGECLDDHPKRRPTMAELVVKLQSLQERHYSSVNESSLFEKVWSLFPAVDRVARSNDDTVDSFGSKLTSNQSPKLVTDAEQLFTDVGLMSVKFTSNQSLKHFTHAELVSATAGFKYMEYVPGSRDGTVYKGWVDKMTYAPTEVNVGLAVYVRINQLTGPTKLDIKFEEFIDPNLAKIFGYCLHENNFFHVYEYYSSASLDDYLYGKRGVSSLSWLQRLKIAVGTAQALAVLHKRMHRAYMPFTSSVILLDADLNAKLSHFEVEKSFIAQNSYLVRYGIDPRIFTGNEYYAAPEWSLYRSDMMSLDEDTMPHPSDDCDVKSEIYAFGVVLLQILTGQELYDVKRPKGKRKIVEWAAPLLREKKNLQMIIDPKLKHNYPPEGAFKLALIVSKCLQYDKGERPTMKEILELLFDCSEDETT